MLPLTTSVVTFVVFIAFIEFSAPVTLLVTILLPSSASVVLSSLTTATPMPKATPTSEAEIDPEAPRSSTSVACFDKISRPLLLLIASYIPALVVPFDLVTEIVPAKLAEP